MAALRGYRFQKLRVNLGAIGDQYALALVLNKLYVLGGNIMRLAIKLRGIPREWRKLLAHWTLLNVMWFLRPLVYAIFVNEGAGPNPNSLQSASISVISG